MKKSTKIYSLIMLIAAVSFAGFWIEDIWMSFIQKHMDNRNMCLPFLLGYGFGAVAIHLIFGTPRDMRVLCWRVPIKSLLGKYALYFVTMVLAVSLGELTLGTTVEALTGNIWWDYRNMPFHFTPYVSLYTSLGLGAVLTVFMGFAFAPMRRFFETWNPKALKVCAIVLAVLLVGDYLFSMVYMLVHHRGIFLWRIFF